MVTAPGVLEPAIRSPLRAARERFRCRGDGVRPWKGCSSRGQTLPVERHALHLR